MTQQDYESRQASLMLTTPLVVAFAGYAGVGKNTAADALLLHDESGRKWVSIAVADAIRDALLTVNPTVTDMARYVSHWPRYVSHPWCVTSTIGLLKAVAEHGWDAVHRWPEVRTMQEQLGAWGRDVSCGRMWSDILGDRIVQALEAGYSVVVPDVRHRVETRAAWEASCDDAFEAEYQDFLVMRPGVGPVSDNELHATAWMEGHAFDHRLHNDSDVATLHSNVHAALAAYGVGPKPKVGAP